MIRITLSSKGVKDNVNDLIISKKIPHDVVCDWIDYKLLLRSWWEFKYNSDQPTEIIQM